MLLPASPLPQWPSEEVIFSTLLYLLNFSTWRPSDSDLQANKNQFRNKKKIANWFYFFLSNIICWFKLIFLFWYKVLPATLHIYITITPFISNFYFIRMELLQSQLLGTLASIALSRYIYLFTRKKDTKKFRKSWS